ncbi:hypothetical protein [Amycolatopsis kentuckyensis]|uniref:hypothetical protein n=1 Tax=Amycolatopsis kentuckyensis TaxID=218823 RepID=UPI000A3784AD|nr:hypothetical protein [Amycolatopsis kentuckyensis]
MLELTEPQVVDSGTGGKFEMVHLVCDCDETKSLCGVDVAVDVDSSDPEDECVVCQDLQQFDCERCGE